jgi:hypothetical protein
VIENVRRFVAGEPLLNPVDPLVDTDSLEGAWTNETIR